MRVAREKRRQRRELDSLFAQRVGFFASRLTTDRALRHFFVVNLASLLSERHAYVVRTAKATQAVWPPIVLPFSIKPRSATSRYNPRPSRAVSSAW